MAVEMRKAASAGSTVEIGTRRQEVLGDFLENFLPKRYFVGTGIVVSKLGRSDQQDIVVFYGDYARLPQTRGGSTFPVEGVAGVIQVKTTLSEGDLKKAVKNIATAKALFRDMGYRPFGVVFALNCPAPAKRKAELQSLNKIIVEPYLTVDRVYVLNKLLMAYVSTNSTTPSLLAQNGDALWGFETKKATLLHFYRYLIECLVVRPHETFKVDSYVPKYFEKYEFKSF